MARVWFRPYPAGIGLEGSEHSGGPWLEVWLKFWLKVRCRPRVKMSFEVRVGTASRPAVRASLEYRQVPRSKVALQGSRRIAWTPLSTSSHPSTNASPYSLFVAYCWRLASWCTDRYRMNQQLQITHSWFANCMGSSIAEVQSLSAWPDPDSGIPISSSPCRSRPKSSR